MGSAVTRKLSHLTMHLLIPLALFSTLVVLVNTRAVDPPGTLIFQRDDDDDATCDEQLACRDDDNETCDCPPLNQDDTDLLECTDDDDDQACTNLGRQKKSGVIVDMNLKWNGIWGDWGDIEYCRSGSFAHGFQLRSEPPQGSGDDTALNAIGLLCRDPHRGPFRKFITSAQGKWGEWTGFVFCPGGPITGIRVREEGRQGLGDDTALNDISLSCSRLFSISADVKTSWGVWKDWQYCPEGFAVAGLRTRVESPQGSGDDTALNGVELYCKRYV